MGEVGSQRKNQLASKTPAKTGVETKSTMETFSSREATRSTFSGTPTSKPRLQVWKQIVIEFICRVLLRIRMLHYIKHDIIGDLAQQIGEGVPIG